MDFVPDQFEREYRGSKEVIGVINTDRGLRQQPPILNTNELLRSPLMSEIYIPLKENELPGLRESIQNFDINDVDIEPMKTLSGKSHPMYGKENKWGRHTEETKQKQREASTGVILSAETRKKLSEFNTGKTLSPEHRKKISESHFGIRPSAETRKKMREAKIGNKASEETKKKMRESHKNRPPISEETRKKLMGNTNAKKKTL